MSRNGLNRAIAQRRDPHFGDTGSAIRSSIGQSVAKELDHGVTKLVSKSAGIAPQHQSKHAFVDVARTESFVLGHELSLARA